MNDFSCFNVKNGCKQPFVTWWDDSLYNFIFRDSALVLQIRQGNLQGWCGIKILSRVGAERARDWTMSHGSNMSCCKSDHMAKSRKYLYLRELERKESICIKWAWKESGTRAYCRCARFVKAAATRVSLTLLFTIGHTRANNGVRSGIIFRRNRSHTMLHFRREINSAFRGEHE